MTTGYQVNGVDLASIFGAKGGATAAATGYKTAGTDLNQQLLALSDGQASSVTTGYKVNGADLNTIFGVPLTSLPINGGTYSAGVVIPSGRSGSAAIQFELTSTTAWSLTCQSNANGGTATPANGSTYASGSVPASAAKIQYTLTYQAASGDTGAGTPTNNASSPTALAAGLLASVSLGGTGSGSPKQSTYTLEIQFLDSGSSVISTTTCTWVMSTEGSA